MKSKLVVIVFLCSILVITGSGFYAFNVSREIIFTFHKDQTNFESIATAAAEVSSYVKRAEGHLMLYLIFDRQADKEKLPKRVESLKEQIAILDEKINDPSGKELLEEIKSRTARMESGLNELMILYNRDLNKKGRFDITEYSQNIFKLHGNFSGIRKLGVELSKLEIDLERQRKENILQQASTLRFYMTCFSGLLFLFVIYTGYIIFSTMRRLKDEIEERIKSQEIIKQEHDKLKKAMDKVKILSGMLPICASCKKIRDDKGYWNQIENYIKSHSDARFTHGLCPDCAKRLYPDIDLE